MGAASCNPNTGKAKAGIFLGLHSRYSDTFDEFQVHKGILSQNLHCHLRKDN